MKADFEFEPKELARSAAKFCRNLRAAELEWGVIKTRFADALLCLNAGSFSTMEMNMARARLVCFMESFRHAWRKRPEIFDAESGRVLSNLESLTLGWVRREMDTKGNRLVDMPCERWMGAWQDFCNAYESFSRTVEFELTYEEVKDSGHDEQGDNPRNDNVNPAILKASDLEAKAYMDGREWCTAAYAKKRFGIDAPQLTKASTRPKGLFGVVVERKLAQVGKGRKGILYVHHRGSLQLLIDAIDRQE